MRKIKSNSAQRPRLTEYCTAVLVRRSGGMSPLRTPAPSSAFRFDLTVCSFRSSRVAIAGIEAGPRTWRSRRICTRVAEPKALMACISSAGSPGSIFRGMSPSSLLKLVMTNKPRFII